MGGSDAELKSLGYPNILAGHSKAPFDVLGDTLRAPGVMMDIPPSPTSSSKRLISRCRSHCHGISTSSRPATLIFMPLHKGADGFLSDEQFRKFYWPTLKQVIEGLIEGGCIPTSPWKGVGIHAWKSCRTSRKRRPYGWLTSRISKSEITIGKRPALPATCPFPVKTGHDR